MKYFLPIIQPQRIVTVLVLISILSLSATVTLGCQTSASSNSSPNSNVPEENPESSSNSLLPSVKEETSNPTEAQLPSAVAEAVLQAASQEAIVPISQLQITQTQQQTWPDGCLGISTPDTLCTQALVPGWRVTVAGKGQSLIYRTDDSGSVVKLEKATAQLPTESNLPNTISPAVQIPMSKLPPPLAKDTVFRAIASGGFIGRTYETTLLEDGQVMRVLKYRDGSTGSPRVSQISSQEVQQFQQLLEQVDFAQFNQLSYPPPVGAADYITVVMSSQGGTTSYVDMAQHELPESLQTVIQAWNQIAKF